jgi:hypothetical protein
MSLKDPEPQVIAAYAVNNKVRVSLNLAPLPTITMICTNPIFYKITVTAELTTHRRSARNVSRD